MIALTGWWRGWWSTWSPRRRDRGAPRTRVILPGVVDVPADVLRSLRAQDERFDLYVLPDGRVWLLFKSDKASRIDAGRLELGAAKAEGFQEPMYAASLMAQGFELIEEVPYGPGLSAGFLLTMAQDWTYLTEAEIRARSKARREKSDGTEHKRRARAMMRERVVLGGKSDYAWAFQGRRSFSNAR